MARLGLLLEDDLEMLESTIEDLVLQNLDSMDWGIDGTLIFYDRQPLISIGQPDILLQDSGSETLYVIELKAGWAMREHVGQLASYVSWYQQNKPAQFRDVKGILLAKNVSEGARYALQLYPELKARCFDLHVKTRAA